MLRSLRSKYQLKTPPHNVTLANELSYFRACQIPIGKPWSAFVLRFVISVFRLIRLEITKEFGRRLKGGHVYISWRLETPREELEQFHNERSVAGDLSEHLARPALALAAFRDSSSSLFLHKYSQPVKGWEDCLWLDIQIHAPRANHLVHPLFSYTKGIHKRWTLQIFYSLRAAVAQATIVFTFPHETSDQWPVDHRLPFSPADMWGQIIHRSGSPNTTCRHQKPCDDLRIDQNTPEGRFVPSVFKLRDLSDRVSLKRLPFWWDDLRSPLSEPRRRFLADF